MGFATKQIERGRKVGSVIKWAMGGEASSVTQHELVMVIAESIGLHLSNKHHILRVWS